MLAGLVPLMAGAQTSPFTMKGKLGNYSAPAKVYFDYMSGDGGGKSDSAVLVNGAFTFTGAVSGPAAVRMCFTPRGDGKERAIYTGDVIYFYIGNEQISITSKDSLAHATITGSGIDDQYNAYNKAIDGPIMRITKEANEEFNSGTEEQKKDTAYLHVVDKHFREKIKNMQAKQLEYARNNPSSYFSLVALSELASSAASAAMAQPVYDKLDESLKSSPTGKDLEARLHALTAVVTGSMAPDFTENDVNGKPITLSQIRGKYKYVLVDFWASWCHPCREETPNLSRQYQLYKDKGFQVLSVSLDDNKTRWQDAIAKDGMPWLHVSDLKGWNNEAGKLYGVRGVPASFLIDPQGKIVATNLRGEELVNKLKELFN